MTLAGGDHHLLTLSEFLHCGYTLLVDEYVRISQHPQGVDLMAAQEALALVPKKAPVGPAVVPEQTVARQNENALKELEKMMGAVSR